MHSHEDTEMSIVGHVTKEVERDDVVRENKQVAFECPVQKVECDNPVRTIVVDEDGGAVVSICRYDACDPVV